MDILLGCESLRPPLTGIGHYTLALARGLSQNPHISNLLCFSPDHNLCSFEQLEHGTCEAEKSNSPWGRGLKKALRPVIRALPGAYPLRDLLRRRRFCQTVKKRTLCSLYHEPGTILKPYAGPSVVTVHDLSHLHYPEFHPRERVRYLNRRLPQTLEKATHIITDSEYVRRELISLLGVDARRITAIPLGVAEHYHPRDRQQTQKILEKYRLLHQSYLLAVSTLEPRKNLEGLVRNYLRLPAKTRQTYPLVVVGGVGWRCRALRKMLNRLETEGQLRQLGYVKISDLAVLYAGAKAFAYPAFYEGFGLPLLEAMASGVPVLTSVDSAMSEVVGENAGFFVVPEDDESLYAGIEQLLENQSLADQYARRGLERASRYNWTRCVEKTVDLYQQIVS